MRYRGDDEGIAERFPYAKRAAAARQARIAVDTAHKAVTNRRDENDPKTVAWRRAIAAHRTAVEAAYPPGYRAAVENLRKGRRRGIDLIIDFLEADPIFFRSGYEKEEIIRHLKRAPLDPAQAERLRGVVVRIVQERDAREFRHYCRLAHRVDAAALRAALALLSADPDEGRRRRAAWMLDALDHAERTARKRQAAGPTP